MCIPDSGLCAAVRRPFSGEERAGNPVVRMLLSADFRGGIPPEGRVSAHGQAGDPARHVPGVQSYPALSGGNRPVWRVRQTAHTGESGRHRQSGGPIYAGGLPAP